VQQRAAFNRRFGGIKQIAIGDFAVLLIGTVKYVRDDKGYAFIKRDDGERDVFVHVHDVQRAGLESLAVGQRLEFDILPDRRDESGTKMRAVDIRLVA
jgi:CspA family cold shock protein